MGKKKKKGEKINFYLARRCRLIIFSITIKFFLVRNCFLVCFEIIRMEDNQNYQEEFLNNIPEGFEIPSDKLSYEWRYFYGSIDVNANRRRIAKCMFCRRECEGRVERLPHHFLDKRCEKIPSQILNEYEAYYTIRKSKKKNQQEIC